jgi:hypothetical protein
MELILIWMFILSTMMAGIIGLLIFRNRGKEKEKFDIRSVARDRLISSDLTELRFTTDADRAGIMRFHNGQMFLPSNPVWSITISHEVTRNGVAHNVDFVQRLPVSRIPDLIEPMFSGESYSDAIVVPPPCPNCKIKPIHGKHGKSIVFVDVNKLTGYSKFHLEQMGITTLVLCSLMSGSDVVGVLCLDFMDKTIDVNSEEACSVMKKMCEYAERVQYLLS